jgi:hypothetical protein
VFVGSVTRITRKEAAMTETFRESASLKKRLYEHCTKSCCACNVLITNEILVEATGVELFRVLITRNLLILGTATTAKKAPLPDPLYVYCTKMLVALEFHRHYTATTVLHRFAGTDREEHPASTHGR